MSESNSKVSMAAAEPSLVQHFSVEGLFGYRTLSLDSDFAATVLIARNGAGKTTILGALDAFLRCQFGRLEGLNFKRIICKLRNVNSELVLHKSDLDDLLALASVNNEILRTAKAYELDAAELLFFVLWEFPSLVSSRADLVNHPVFAKIYRSVNFTFETSVNLFKKLHEAVSIPLSPIFILMETVMNAMANVDIVYLPTYRRIELSLPEPEEKYYSGRKALTVQAKLGLTRRGLYAGDIQFGLSDISARLKELNRDIMFESNQKYAEISANIIDDLISGSFEEQVPSLDERPSKDELRIFFERMKAGERNNLYRYGPYGPAKILDIDRIYSGDIPANTEKFLIYFLGKLNNVIQKTRETERVVESFRVSCNRYLSVGDPTTFDPPTDIDQKFLRLDRASLDVSVWRTKPEVEVPLDALSSGEKQMVSLFARLYLYPKTKLILIDEPELSLSIDWQRKILPDILESALCKQVIAITHSPFIFDNALDSFATHLKVSNSD